MERRDPWLILAAAGSIAAAAAVSWLALPRTEHRARVVAEERPRTVDVLARRSFFFGHAELSDLLDGLSLLSDSVDAFANAQQLRDLPTHPIRRRLLTGVDKLPALTRRRLGMSEIYTLPSMYFLFEEENPREAIGIVRQGVDDPRVSPNVAMLAAFVAHVFLRDPVVAGGYYLGLAEREGIPTWVGELGRRLAAGEDPYVTQPKLRKELCRIVVKVFPRSRRYLEGRAGAGHCGAEDEAGGGTNDGGRQAP